MPMLIKEIKYSSLITALIINLIIILGAVFTTMYSVIKAMEMDKQQVTLVKVVNEIQINQIQSNEGIRYILEEIKILQKETTRINKLHHLNNITKFD